MVLKKNTFYRKLFGILIILFILIISYLVLVSYPYFFSKINPHDSLGVLSVIEEKPIIISNDPSLTAGEKVTARVKATENNLGMVLVRFIKFGIGEDRIAFRIKEEGGEDWHYEHSDYRAEEFQINEYFTFGFPPITNSKNKTYVFEIESLRGSDSGVGFNNKRTQTALVYKYSKKDLFDFSKLSSFISKKAWYVLKNNDFLSNWQILVASLLIYFFIIFTRKERIVYKKKRGRKIVRGGFLSVIFREHQMFMELTKKIRHRFTATKFYLTLLNTEKKKKLIIFITLFTIAFLYRFSNLSLEQLGTTSFYSSLGGGGDYDQFIRASTCAITSFCPAILGQNFLIESSILGIFFELFGFVGGINVYLYLMVILSSAVATFPYLILSRKNFYTTGGIIGSLYLSTSNYFTNMALALPPDNGSLFVFSVFYIVYLLTLSVGSMHWLFLLGLMGVIDGLNKLVFLLNDLVVLALFVSVFFIEKAKKIKKFPFIKHNPDLIFKSFIPFIVFLVIYSAWEIFVENKFGVHYYLRSLIEGGTVYASSTDVGSASVVDSLSKGNILEKLYYLAGLSIVMTRRIIISGDLNIFLLAPVLFGLLFVTFQNKKYLLLKLIMLIVFICLSILALILFRNNYLDIQEIGQYVYAWTDETYTNIFLLSTIIFIFVLNFRYRAIKYALPIIPYFIMLLLLTKNAPWLRMLAHVIVWEIILLSFLLDWVLDNIKKNKKLNKLWTGPVILLFFIIFYTTPKISTMVTDIKSNSDIYREEIKYLTWANSQLPKNAIILAGGKTDLVTTAQNINKPIIYNTSWTGALLIKPEDIPGVKPTDFAILSQLKMNQTPTSNFSIVSELKNKDNFKKKRYIILENDISLWKERISGVGDNLFSTSSASLLQYDNYSLKIYKTNPVLNKRIYKLEIREVESP